MTVEMTKAMCVDLVVGCSGPHYRLFEEMNDYGYYSDSRGWMWDRLSLNSLSEEQLLNLYHKCKTSWE